MNSMKNETGLIISKLTSKSYKEDNALCCTNGGIYVVDASCSGQYTGKTTIFGTRAKEHFVQKSSSVYTHKQHCQVCMNIMDFKITFVESYLRREKYSLSEREFLWNFRIKGSINTQKTLNS